MTTPPVLPSMGNLFIVSAPSGAGKTTIVTSAINKLDNIQVSISHTTREKRTGESNSKNYYFTDPQTFEKMIADGQFLEHATVFGHYYGTSRKWIEDTLAKGTDIILEIDWQGAEQICANYPTAVSIFILPPSQDILHQRLINRGQDKAAVIEQRMAQAKAEISHYKNYDYLIINDNLETAIANISAIIHATRLQTAKQAIKYASMLNDLML